MLNQRCVFDPDDIRAGEHLTERHALVRRVEHAGASGLDHVEDPAGEVADVDELERTVGRPRREHRSAARDAHGPVGEAVGRVVRPDDETGADDQRAAAVHVLHGPLAQCLQRPVVLEFVAELLDRLVLDRPHRPDSSTGFDRSA